MQVEVASAPGSIGLAVSEQSDLRALRDWLRGLPVEVELRAGIPGPGELGVVDTLTVLAGSGGLVAAVRTLPDFIRSRRSGLKIEMTVRGERFVMEATNTEDVLPILERLLDE